MPGVRVGRHARIRRAIIDRDVLIPRGALIGFDPEEDRRRHTVTEGGVVDRDRRGRAADRPDQRGGAARRGRSRPRRRAASTLGRHGRAHRVHRETRMQITRVHGREILDSRGNPTVEVDVWAGSAFGRAAVPSGASTGEREALELRDGDKQPLPRQGRAQGGRPHQRRDRRRRCAAQTLDQRARRPHADRRSTARRPRAGSAPTRCSASRWRRARAAAAAAGTAAVRAPRAAERRAPGDGTYVLPVPMMNILNGGAHADSSVDLQEFMVMPVGHADVRRGAARRHRDLPRAARDPEEGRPLDRRRRRRRLRAEPQVEPRSARRRARGHRQGRAHGRAGRLPRARRRVERALGQRQVRLQEVGRADAHAGTRWSRCTPSGCGSIRSSRSRTASPKATGTAGRR